MSNLLALPGGTELVGDYRIGRVLGAGGFGITYLADELALSRRVTIKEYFPSDFAARAGDIDASPRSKDCAGDYKWGLERFIEEAQTLARFDHPNIVRVYRYFRANNTGYMVLHFEEGQSFKSWLKSLGRAPRQAELDAIVAPLLDALEIIHRGDFLHRDIAPDNIIIRKDGEPVLIDFGSARGDLSAQSRTVSALVKPGYSPYEQYGSTSRNQGPWTDIYALGATLYQAVTGRRPPDAPSRVVADDIVPARDAAISSYRAGFLAAIDRALALEVGDRPQSIPEWRGQLLAPDERPARAAGLGLKLGLRRALAAEPEAAPALGADMPSPPDAPQARGQLLDFIDALKKPPTVPSRRAAEPAPPSPVSEPDAVPAAARAGLGYGPAALSARAVPQPVAMPVAAAAPSRSVKTASDIKRRPVRRLRRAGKRKWLPPLIKLAIGLAVAGAIVTYEDRLPALLRRLPSPLPSQQQAAALPETPAASSQTRIDAHAGGVLGAVFSDDRLSLASIGADNRIKLWSADKAILIRAIDPGFIQPASFAVAGRRALAGFADGHVAVIDLDRGTTVASVRFGEQKITAVSFTGSGERFAAAGSGGRIALYDLALGTEPQKVLDGHEGGTSALTYSQAKERLLSAGADGTLKSGELSGDAVPRAFRANGARIELISPSADGRSVATGGPDGAARVWSLSSRRLVRAHVGNGPISAVALSPDATVLAIAREDGTIRLRDARIGRTLATLSGHAGAVRALAFSLDGRQLLSGGADGTLRTWTVLPARIARD